MHTLLMACKSCPEMNNIRRNLKSFYESAVSAVQPKRLVESAIKLNNGSIIVSGKEYPLNKNCYVVGFGKAVLGMSVAVHQLLGKHIRKGILSVPVGSMQLAAATQLVNSSISVYEGANNNLPDTAAYQTSQKIADLVKSLDGNTLLIALISGGGSALLPSPKEGITLQQKCDVINLLQGKGASIQELNCVRKRLSTLKSGGLARLAYPAHVVSLILSDIVNDPLEYIASGPTFQNTDEPNAALNIIKKYNFENAIDRNVLLALKDNTPHNENLNGFDHVQNVIIGNNKTALEAAQEIAKKTGYLTAIFSNTIEHSVSILAHFYSSLSLYICNAFRTNDYQELQQYLSQAVKTYNLDSDFTSRLINIIHIMQDSQTKGICLIGGGEPTVQLEKEKSGSGGRSQELALRFSILMHEHMVTKQWDDFHVVLMCAGTDGIDGPTDAAGAFGYGEQIAWAFKEGLKPQEYQDCNNSYGYFSLVPHDLIKIGHTGTNVMDLHILLIQPKSS